MGYIQVANGSMKFSQTCCTLKDLHHVKQTQMYRCDVTVIVGPRAREGSVAQPRPATATKPVSGKEGTDSASRKQDTDSTSREGRKEPN